MNRCRVGLVCICMSAWVPAHEVTAAEETLIPVSVTGTVGQAVVNQGDPIPLTVTIGNGLKGPIRYSTFGLEPSDWNGETINLTLVDIYRDGKPKGLFRARPRVDVPDTISGMASYPIEAGEKLTVGTDARKWTIERGWRPGKYRVSVR
ncbi:MAG: hypothetical protein ACOY3P_15840, partial [Planctomycetota bacterium]